ncbi:Omp28-related outer membrane protein [bacterium]|nr:Omp28-related outer membrane protein [bacterium]
MPKKVVPTPCNVSISGSISGSTANVDVNVNFVDYPVNPQNLRVTLFVVEDSVTGTGSGYNQVNYYNSIAGHPYYGKGNPIVGFVHKHVVRSVPTGTWGDATYFTSNPTLNSIHSNSYSVSIDPNWKMKDISFVAFVNYYNPNGGLDEYEILNVEEVKLSSLVGAKENIASKVDFSVYPNPARDIANVTLNLKESANVEVAILDMTGKQVSFINFGSVNVGTQILELNTSDLSDGLYFVNLKIGDEMKSTKIAVMK